MYIPELLALEEFSYTLREFTASGGVQLTPFLNSRSHQRIQCRTHLYHVYAYNYSFEAPSRRTTSECGGVESSNDEMHVSRSSAARLEVQVNNLVQGRKKMLGGLGACSPRYALKSILVHSETNIIYSKCTHIKLDSYQ